MADRRNVRRLVTRRYLPLRSARGQRAAGQAPREPAHWHRLAMRPRSWCG